MPEAEAPPPAGIPDHSSEELSQTEAEQLRRDGARWALTPAGSFDHEIEPDLTMTSSRGSRLGERYVRVTRAERQGFQPVAPGWLQATPRVGAPTGSLSRAGSRVRRTLLGAPLTTRQFSHERLTKIKALAVLSSDALSSVAYATDQIVGVLALAGVSALGASIPIMLAILALLSFVVLSYRQTIRAYPKGGGSYIVAKDNLGPLAGLVAAAALMTDYVLTVAVSVASGMDQIQGALPSLATYRVEICIGMIILIMLGNLRGIRESGAIFAAPTYLFIGGMFLMIGTLIVRTVTHTMLPAAETGYIGHAVESLTVFLVLKAFASGCTALTGVEAISDGVPAFKPPEWVNARRTLTVMAIILGSMFVGITLLAQRLQAHAIPTNAITGEGICAGPHGGPVGCGYLSVIGQLAARAFGNGSPLFVVIAIVTTLILILAANTSFSDFPRLLFFLARDDYAPHQFRRLGDRLAYSNGILVLGILAIIIETAFGAQVNALIPLYAVGVFAAFTLSQAGMVTRWLRRREPGWRHSLPLNFAGMCLTGTVFVIFGGTKFTSGAWVVLIIIPSLVVLFRAIHRHYQETAEQVTTEIPTSPEELHPICIVPIAELDRVALQSLAMARSLTATVVAVHVCDDEVHIRRLRERWEAWGNHVPLTILESPYRSFLRPLLGYIDAIDRQRTDDTLVVVLPELVATRWWHQVLHNQTALRLKGALLFRPGTVVISVPYHLTRGQQRRHFHRGGDPDAL